MKKIHPRAFKLKEECHDVIDKIVLCGWGRTTVYRRLAQKLGRPMAETHFAKIDDLRTLWEARAALEILHAAAKKDYRDKMAAKRRKQIEIRDQVRTGVPTMVVTKRDIASRDAMRKAIAEAARKNGKPQTVLQKLWAFLGL